MIDPRKKFDRERSSEVRKMLGCLNANTRIAFLFADAFVLFSINISGVEEELLQAAKDVANVLEGDSDKIEQDLLSQLKGHVRLTAAQKDGQLPGDSSNGLR